MWNFSESIFTANLWKSKAKWDCDICRDSYTCICEKAKVFKSLMLFSLTSFKSLQRLLDLSSISLQMTKKEIKSFSVVLLLLNLDVSAQLPSKSIQVDLHQDKIQQRFSKKVTWICVLLRLPLRFALTRKFSAEFADLFRVGQLKLSFFFYRVWGLKGGSLITPNIRHAMNFFKEH